MKYQERHLRFEIEYQGHLITITESASFDFDSAASEFSQDNQAAIQRPQTILRFAKPSLDILGLLKSLYMHQDIHYPVAIGILKGKMHFEAIEIEQIVRISGEFTISQTVIL
jgi:hypothetical protein